MTVGRNCVAIDRNPVCCKGMVYRMQMLKGLPDPNAECGEAGVFVDSDEEKAEAGQACSSDKDEDVAVNSPVGQAGTLVDQ